MNCGDFRYLIQRRFDVELSSADDRALLIHLETCDACQKFYHQVQQVIIAAEEMNMAEDSLPQDPDRLANNINQTIPHQESGMAAFISGFLSRWTFLKSLKKVGVGGGQSQSGGILDPVNGDRLKQRLPGRVENWGDGPQGQNQAAAPPVGPGDSAENRVEGAWGTWSTSHLVNDSSNPPLADLVNSSASEEDSQPSEGDTGVFDEQRMTRSLGEKFSRFVQQSDMGSGSNQRLTLAESIRRRVAEMPKPDPAKFAQTPAQGAPAPEAEVSDEGDSLFNSGSFSEWGIPHSPDWPKINTGVDVEKTLESSRGNAAPQSWGTSEAVWGNKAVGEEKQPVIDNFESQNRGGWVQIAGDTGNNKDISMPDVNEAEQQVSLSSADANSATAIPNVVPGLSVDDLLEQRHWSPRAEQLETGSWQTVEFHEKQLGANTGITAVPLTNALNDNDSEWNLSIQERAGKQAAQSQPSQMQPSQVQSSPVQPSQVQPSQAQSLPSESPFLKNLLKPYAQPSAEPATEQIIQSLQPASVPMQSQSPAESFQTSFPSVQSQPPAESFQSAFSSPSAQSQPSVEISQPSPVPVQSQPFVESFKSATVPVQLEPITPELQPIQPSSPPLQSQLQSMSTPMPVQSSQPVAPPQTPPAQANSLAARLQNVIQTSATGPKIYPVVSKHVAALAAIDKKNESSKPEVQAPVSPASMPVAQAVQMPVTPKPAQPVQAPITPKPEQPVQAVKKEIEPVVSKSNSNSSLFNLDDPAIDKLFSDNLGIHEKSVGISSAPAAVKPGSASSQQLIPPPRPSSLSTLPLPPTSSSNALPAQKPSVTESPQAPVSPVPSSSAAIASKIAAEAGHLFTIDDTAIDRIFSDNLGVPVQKDNFPITQSANNLAPTVSSSAGEVQVPAARMAPSAPEQVSAPISIPLPAVSSPPAQALSAQALSTSPLQSSFVQSAPAQSMPVQPGPVQSMPVQSAPLQATPLSPAVPPQGSPVESISSQSMSRQKLTGVDRLDGRAEPTTEGGSGRIAAIGKFLLDSKDLEKIGKITASDLSERGMRTLSLEAHRELSNLLTQIDSQVGVIGTMIVGHDGLLIANTVPQEMEAESLSKWAQAIYMGTAQVTEQLGSEKVRQIVSQTERGYLIIANFGAGLLISITNPLQIEYLLPLMRTITQLVAS